MPAPGCNDPCPCGSGRKHKHCCLAKAQPATGITRADRTEAMEALTRYLRRTEFDQALAHAALLWAADDFAHDWQAALESIAAHETSLAAFFEWLYFDVRLDDGRALAARCLDDRGRSLGPRAADYMRLMQTTHLRPYQIRRVRSGHGFEARDLWTGEDVAIDEHAATTMLVIWDILAARPVQHADGTRQIEGTPLALPPAVADDLRKALKTEHRSWTRTHRGEPLEQIFKNRAPVFHDFWATSTAEPELPVLHTPEGDALTMSTLTFRRPLKGDLVAMLGGQSDFEVEPGLVATTRRARVDRAGPHRDALAAGTKVPALRTAPSCRTPVPPPRAAPPCRPPVPHPRAAPPCRTPVPRTCAILSLCDTSASCWRRS